MWQPPTTRMLDETEVATAEYERAELMEMTHEFIKEYVLAVDRKASILMTALFGLLGLSANAVNALGLSLRTPVLALVIVAAFWGVVGIVFSAWVIYPRVYAPHDPGFIYWERIRQFGGRDEFVAAVKGMDADQPLAELSKNVYNTSDIASRKYSWLRRSMAATGLMFYAATAAVLLVLTDRLLASLAVPTLLAVGLVHVLLAEDENGTAQTTAAFRADDEGRLELYLDATDERIPDADVVAVGSGDDDVRVRVEGLDPGETVHVTNPAAERYPIRRR